MLRWATPELHPKISFQIDATRACFVRTPARCPNASRNPCPVAANNTMWQNQGSSRVACFFIYTYPRVSRTTPMLCGSAQLLPATPIYVGPRLVLNLQQPNFGFSHILQLASLVDHTSFFCPRAIVAKRAVPFFT
ncbi:hypothetical protein DEO72_LG6g1148 [Vigna unguiculata]|uniref:Uncharacterized protein n=1 Tax=Vigna unguiculata TaxID=3917 RepID=A0A4D6M5G5_VIGUN|nr:hypothetical protein DEO72_LG6g1148 [Vigna unguiculata]